MSNWRSHSHLDVWPSAGTWLTSRRLHSSKELTLPLPAAINCQYLLNSGASSWPPSLWCGDLVWLVLVQILCMLSQQLFTCTALLLCLENTVSWYSSKTLVLKHFQHLLLVWSLGPGRWGYTIDVPCWDKAFSNLIFSSSWPMWVSASSPIYYKKTLVCWRLRELWE